MIIRGYNTFLPAFSALCFIIITSFFDTAKNRSGNPGFPGIVKKIKIQLDL